MVDIIGAIMPDKRSRKTFDRYWALVILPEIISLTSEPGVTCASLDYARDSIYNAYCNLNRYYSEKYLRQGTDLLDRHKVAACYSYAIVAAQPLTIAEDIIVQSADIKEIYGQTCSESSTQIVLSSIANGRLALSVGASVLMSYMRQSIRALKLPDEDEYIRRLGNNLVFPSHDEVAHGRFETDLANYLCISGIEENYNVPLLGMIFYLLERESFLKQFDIKFYFNIQKTRRLQHAASVSKEKGDSDMETL